MGPDRLAQLRNDERGLTSVGVLLAISFTLIVAVMVVMLLTLPWMMDTMTSYATELFLSFFRFVG